MLREMEKARETERNEGKEEEEETYITGASGPRARSLPVVGSPRNKLHASRRGYVLSLLENFDFFFLLWVKMVSARII